jgi:hypothetical protein
MVTEGGPSASDVVYLFGDRFARKARLGAEQLVYGGAKVKLSELVDKMMVAAFADLASKGYVGLEKVEQKKLAVFTWRDVEVTRLSTPAETLFGLDAAIWEKLTGDPRQDRVREIIRRITGGTRLNPWRDLVALTKEGLAEQGFLVVEKEERRLRPDKVTWSANEEAILAHEGRADEVKALLASLETRDPELYKQLEESVKRGIEAMKQQDYDFDSD